MLKIPNYQIHTKIHESTNSQVYRGINESDHSPAIFKVLKKDYPSPEEITRYKLEYQITQNFSTTGVIKAYDLQQLKSKFVIIFEDFGGQSLDNILKTKKFTLMEFLQLAIQLTEILSEIHTANIIHKDINPSNIVLSLETQQLKIIDFGIATDLSRETLSLQHPSVIEGTLAYISPEQTGRMNRSLDYRTDFYSLGATFYQLLTNRLLFETNDALELIHYHLALEPVAPHLINPNIPPVLSEIVLKLLAKTAENRYQSAWGIKIDLEECLQQLQQTGHIESFPLTQQDISDKFHIPEKLYGREREVEMLLAAFARSIKIQGIKPNNGIEMILVAGYSGIGKSALVQEIYKTITRHRGYFIAGKFEQYQRNIPYFAIAQAFGSLIKQLLTETETQLIEWREKLLAALGANSRVITQVIPALEIIVGNQPDVPILPPTEAQNRFNQVFQKFICVFTQQEHPLVIFLDDLQWVDTASLQLIQLLTTAKIAQSLLLIGAYRDNEVNSFHPLSRMIEQTQQQGAIVNQIFLSPLKLSAINQLIADTLSCQLEDVLSLAELVEQKTNGNPFFMNEFLKSLHTENLLKFNWQNRNWQWSIKQIQEKNITDNVVRLMAFKIQKLNLETQKLLQLSACIGNQCDLEILAFVAEFSPQKTAKILGNAIAQGLILPLSNAHKSVELDVTLPSNSPAIEYKFVHDRIQQAAYSLIPENECQIIHWQIGQRLLQMTSHQQLENRIFDITNQLNQGNNLIQKQSERDDLANLNLMAGKKAKASAAYSSALEYFEISRELLADNSWITQYQLSLEVYSLATEAAYLNGKFEQMEQWVNIVLVNAKSLPDKIKVYEVKIQAYAGQMQFLEALEIGLIALAECGVNLPVSPSPKQIEDAFNETALKLKGIEVDDLINLPVMTDATAPLIMRLLIGLNAPAYQAAPPLFPLIILQMVNWSIEYGNNDLSAYGYAGYSNILGCIILDIDTSYQFIQLALNLLDKFNNPLIRCKTIFMANTSVRFRKIHLQETIQPLLDAYQLGLETGDIEFAAYSILHHCDHCFFTAMPLPELEHKLASYIQALNHLEESTNANALKVYQQTVLNLTTISANPGILIGEVYNESQELPLLKQANHHKGLFYIYFNKLLLCYMFNKFEQAVENANQVENYLDGGRANAVFPIFYFYDSLARLALYTEATDAEKILIQERIKTNQEKMQLWAHHAPMNYQHKWYLVEAERYRVSGRSKKAMKAYDRAISLAKENNYLQEKALAKELAGKFYLEQEHISIAKNYLQDAKYCYLIWGAKAKVIDLKKRYLQLLEPQSEQTKTHRLNGTQSSSTQLEALDLETVLKASQAIASEILLDQLLARLMTILIENAGAQRGYLILQTQDQWQIEAIGSIDNQKVDVLQSIPVESILADNTPYLPTSLINYVARTQESVVLNNATQEGNFQSESWIIHHQSKSILCAPLLNQGNLTGIVLLENNLTTYTFTPKRIEIINLLSTQAAISIHNARLLKQQEELNQSLSAEIDERKKVEISLRQSEQLFVSLAVAAPVGIFRTDADGNCLYVNDRWCQISGLSPEEAMGVSWVKSLHPDDLELVFSEWFQSVQEKRPFKLEYRFQRSDGSISWVFGQSVSENDDDGKVKGYVGTITDISDRKQAEQEVRQLNAELEERVTQRTAQLEAANKALESFSYSVSHDLRAPLRAIDGFSRMMQEDYSNQLDAEANRYLKVVRDNAKRMGELIDDLLNLSRLDSKEMSRQPVSVSDLIKQVLSDLASECSNRQIEFAIADLPTCQADLSLLTQVWTNLLSNAIKYTSYKPVAHIQIGYELINSEGVYFIRDNGAGFDMQYADNLFGVFQRLHREQEFEGTGIGLAIVQRIIQRHGGRIWSQAAVNQGAAFYFTLPNPIKND